jgi:hypothetical protein
MHSLARAGTHLQRTAPTRETVLAPTTDTPAPWMHASVAYTSLSPKIARQLAFRARLPESGSDSPGSDCRILACGVMLRALDCLPAQRTAARYRSPSKDGHVASWPL